MYMSIVEVKVKLGSHQKETLLVRCLPVEEIELRIDLIDGTHIWCSSVDERHTPPALDMAGTHYQ